MPERVCIPVKNVNGENWAQLTVFGNRHILCGEEMYTKRENFSFAGGHRVRLFEIRNNVHWKIPVGVKLDIAEVAPAGAPPRREQRR